MHQYRHLIVIDLSSYGSALAIINHFCDDQQIKVFEVSPVGHSGLLILLVQDEMVAEVLKNEIFSFFKSSILSISLIKNYRPQLLQVYLSQNQDLVQNSLWVQEFSSVARAFEVGQNLLEKEVTLLDFRLIRTFPLNAIVTATAGAASDFVKVKTASSARNSTVIEKVEPVLKSYFEIQKN